MRTITACLVTVLTLAGCAHVQPGAWSCSAASVAAVIDSISEGAPAANVDEAASCWLGLWRDQPRLESAAAKPDHVGELERAMATGDGVPGALVAADAGSPGVCRQ